MEGTQDSQGEWNSDEETKMNGGGSMKITGATHAVHFNGNPRKIVQTFINITMKLLKFICENKYKQILP